MEMYHIIILALAWLIIFAVIRNRLLGWIDNKAYELIMEFYELAELTMLDLKIMVHINEKHITFNELKNSLKIYTEPELDKNLAMYCNAGVLKKVNIRYFLDVNKAYALLAENMPKKDEDFIMAFFEQPASSFTYRELLEKWVGPAEKEISDALISMCNIGVIKKDDNVYSLDMEALSDQLNTYRRAKKYQNKE